MGGFFFVIAGITLAGIVAGLLAGLAMKNGRIGVIKGILWGFLIFFSCCAFPLYSEQVLWGWSHFAVFVFVHYSIGEALSIFYEKKEWKRVCFLSIGMTLAGLVCRYFLEFGEVSNTYNFTLGNIIIYTFVAPLIILMSFFGYKKYKNRQ